MNYNACPGDLLAKELKRRGITLAEFKQATGLDVMGLVQGRKVLTERDAQILSQALESSATFWLFLDDTYRKEA